MVLDLSGRPKSSLTSVPIFFSSSLSQETRNQLKIQILHNNNMNMTEAILPIRAEEK